MGRVPASRPSASSKPMTQAKLVLGPKSTLKVQNPVHATVSTGHGPMTESTPLTKLELPRKSKTPAGRTRPVKKKLLKDENVPAVPGKKKGAKNKEPEKPEPNYLPDVELVTAQKIDEYPLQEITIQDLSIERYDRASNPERLKIYLSNEMLLVIEAKGSMLWEEQDERNIPRIMVDEPLGEKLCALPGLHYTEKSRNKRKENGGGPPLKVLAASWGERRSKGWKLGRPGSAWDDKTMGPLHETKPDWQKHVLLGLQLEGMEKMGWIRCVRDVWNAHWHCPHEITHFDVIVRTEKVYGWREEILGRSGNGKNRKIKN